MLHVIYVVGMLADIKAASRVDRGVNKKAETYNRKYIADYKRHTYKRMGENTL